MGGVATGMSSLGRARNAIETGVAPSRIPHLSRAREVEEYQATPKLPRARRSDGRTGPPPPSRAIRFGEESRGRIFERERPGATAMGNLHRTIRHPR